MIFPAVLLLRRCVITLALGLTSAHAMECPTSVRIAYPDIEAAPIFLGRGAVIPEKPGAGVDMSNIALQRADCRPPVTYTRLSPRRLDMQSDMGEQDIVLGIAPTPERIKRFQFPTKDGKVDNRYAAVPSKFYLYALAASPMALDDTGAPPKNAVVGVLRGQISEEFANSKGWAIDNAPDTEGNFRKLLLGRIDLVLSSDVLVPAVLATLGPSNFRKLEPPVIDTMYFAPSSRSFYERFPQFTEQYWRYLCQEFQRILPDHQKCPR